MPLEREGFREQLERLDKRFEGRETITIKEAESLLGMSKQTLLGNKSFPAKKTTKPGDFGGKWFVPLVGLARWMVAT